MLETQFIRYCQCEVNSRKKKYPSNNNYFKRQMAAIDFSDHIYALILLININETLTIYCFKISFIKGECDMHFGANVNDFEIRSSLDILQGVQCHHKKVPLLQIAARTFILFMTYL